MPEEPAPAREPAARTFNARGLASFYNSILSPRGFQLPPHLVPVCYGLTDLRIPKLLLLIGPGSGKSQLLSQIFPAFLLGHDPKQTILGVSAGESLIQGFVRSVMEIIEWAEIYAYLFPNVRPNKDAGWSTERGLFVTGRAPGDPDASYWAAGLDSKSLTGKHGKTIILDDPHDKDNSNSAMACEKVVTTYYNTIMGRADPAGARFIVAGRRWSENDLYGHLIESGEWVVMELPAMRAGAPDLFYDIVVPDGMTCCFNDGTLDHLYLP